MTKYILNMAKCALNVAKYVLNMAKCAKNVAMYAYDVAMCVLNVVNSCDVSSFNCVTHILQCKVLHW